MNIDKIARLFSAQSEPARSQKSAQFVELKPQNSEAVKVSESLSGSGDAEARARKVAELKAAVNDGSYKVDSRNVAAAVYKELFI